MAASLQELQEKRDNLYSDLKALEDRAGAEERDLTPDEEAQFDTNQTEIKRLTRQIDRMNSILEIGTAIAGPGRLTRPEQPLLDQTAHNTRGLEVASVAAAVPWHYRHKGLRAFRGDRAEEVAYRAGKFFLAAVYRDETARLYCREHGIELLAQGTNVNSAGGILVPEEFERAIIDLRETYGVFRQEARVEPMISDTKMVPRRSSGLTAYFVDENPSSAITESQKAWDSVKLVTKKVATLTRYSTEVGEDAIIDLGDDLASEIAYAFARKEDDCGWLGDGTSTYGGIRGVMNVVGAGSLFTAATGHTAFSTLTLTDFHGVTGQLPEYARPNAKWYFSRPGFSNSAERLAYAGGGNTVDNLSGGKSLAFLGYPVVISQVLNSTLTAQTTTTGLCAFGDLRLCGIFGSRRGVTVAQSEHRYFDTDQIGVRGTERFDVVIHTIDDASTAGPLIVLKTPGS